MKLTKICTRCHKEKEADQYRRHPGFADGLNSACKACLGAADKARYQKKRPEILAQQKEYVAQQKELDPEGFKTRRNKAAANYRANPENTIKLRYLKERYGLTVEQYQEMEKNQAGLCKICQKPPSGRWNRLHVDHDHETGAIRGLLCFTCNVMLGHARDNLNVLQAAIAYLTAPIQPG